MSLNVANCTRCGKIYVKNNFGLCPNCIKSLEVEYQKCLDFLREHRNCSIQELSDETGVAIKQIMKFIREGRISIKNNPNISYECEACGTGIREHNLCEACRARLQKEASNVREDELRRKAQAEAGEHASFKIKDRLKDR